MRDMSTMDNSRKRARKLAQPRIHHALAFFGGVILRVLAQIAMRARLRDLTRQIDAQFHFERRYFFFEFFL